MQYFNRAKHIVFLPLNTGETIHLAAGEASRKLEAFEVDRSTRLDRLVQMGVIEAVAVPAASHERKSSPKSSKGAG